FSANDGDGIESVTAIDIDGSIDYIGHKVSALTAIDIGIAILGRQRIDLNECAHGEVVVVRIAVEREGSNVVVNDEGVVAIATVHGGRLTDAVAQVTTRCQGRIELIIDRQPGIIAPWRKVHLTNLESVLAIIAIERADHNRIINGENVI